MTQYYKATYNKTDGTTGNSITELTTEAEAQTLLESVPELKFSDMISFELVPIEPEE